MYRFFSLYLFFIFPLYGLERTVVLTPIYCHTQIALVINTPYIKNFEAYTSYFDPSGLGTPIAVEYQIKGGKTPGKNKRPSTWSYDQNLFFQGIMSTDKAYLHSGYDRGHMCMKEIGSLISPEADWNTHSLWNCVPQKHALNAGLWEDLEKKTITWADTYSDVWVICGPYYPDKPSAEKIGTDESGYVSVPEFTWKIVVRTNTWHVLAAMYRQSSDGKSPFDHRPYLLSIADIEYKTGIKVGVPVRLKHATNDFEHF